MPAPGRGRASGGERRRQDGRCHRSGLLAVWALRRDALVQPSRNSSLCSPSSGGAVTSSARSPSKETGERTVRNLPVTGCVGLDEHLQVARLRILRHFGRGVHRRVRHVLGQQPRAPVGAVAQSGRSGPSPPSSPPGCGCARRGSAKRSSSKMSGRSIARGQALPELGRRRHVQRDPLVVAAVHHVGLRHARAG